MAATEAPALLLTPDEAGQRLRKSRTYVYQQMALGKLRSVTLGRSRRIPIAELDAFVARELDESGGAYR